MQAGTVNDITGIVETITGTVKDKYRLAQLMTDWHSRNSHKYSKG